ncbi:MAG: spore coat U domain-containing protein [Hyphomicrobiales bacterium]
MPQNTIAVTCTSGRPYTIGLNGGLSGATNPTQRRMRNLAQTSFITYGIYRDTARTLGWGETIGVNTLAGTGTGNVQNYTAYGRVPAQTTPAPQTYSDTIVVTVTY